MYYNTHTHLNAKELYPTRDTYIAHAHEVGVTRMTVVGYDVSSSRLAVRIAHEYEGIVATVGISPNDCEETTDEDLAIIKELAKDPKVVAIGEIGLDYHYDVPKDKQRDVFAKQMAFAQEYHLPIVIHCRDAYEECFQMLESSSLKGIMHCYSGSDQMALRFIKLGFYISLAGPVTFKNAKMPKLVAQNVPLDRLLIETDDPYMAPVPLRGTTNEPANCVYIAQKIAELKGISVEDVASTTYHNALDIFGLKE